MAPKFNADREPSFESEVVRCGRKESMKLLTVAIVSMASVNALGQKGDTLAIGPRNLGLNNVRLGNSTYIILSEEESGFAGRKNHAGKNQRHSSRDFPPRDRRPWLLIRTRL